jgi:hypothetical protein
MAVASILAYHNTTTITAANGFIVQAPGYNIKVLTLGRLVGLMQATLGITILNKFLQHNFKLLLLLIVQVGLGNHLGSMLENFFPSSLTVGQNKLAADIARSSSLKLPNYGLIF